MTQINFDFKNLDENRLKDYKKEIVEQITETLNSIISIDSKCRIFNNTVQPLINVHTILEPKISSFNYASNFYSNKSTRDTASKLEGEIENFLIESSMRKDIYNAFIEYFDTNYQQEKKDLTSEEVRYFEHTMRDFRRDGLHLDNYEEIKELKKELSDICIKFSCNINEENTSFNLTRKELYGLPDSWFNDDRFVE